MKDVFMELRIQKIIMSLVVFVMFFFSSCIDFYDSKFNDFGNGLLNKVKAGVIAGALMGFKMGGIRGAISAGGIDNRVAKIGRDFGVAELIGRIGPGGAEQVIKIGLMAGLGATIGAVMGVGIVFFNADTDVEIIQKKTGNIVSYCLGGYGLGLIVALAIEFLTGRQYVSAFSMQIVGCIVGAIVGYLIE